MITPTAALMIVGNEILSGRTQDANIKFIAERLSLRGITLMEIRVVRDDKDAIINATRALSSAYDLVFSTGGIGSTHDDITAASVAAAFDLPCTIHPEAHRRLAEYYTGRGLPLNEGRMRMAYTPEGASLIDNSVSTAPGFIIGNVHVMAGVPQIMQAMFLWLEDKLPHGTPLMTNTISCSLREGDVAIEMEAIQRKFPDVEIGSYPVMVSGNFSLSLVLRAHDEDKLEAATTALAQLVESLDDTPVIARQRHSFKG